MSSKSLTTAVLFRKFLQQEYISGIILLLSVLAAIIWINYAPVSYDLFRHMPLGIDTDAGNYSIPLYEWINNGLMAIFFLVIGLELKREFIAGELATASKARLPVAAALGGMLVPALIYMLFNHGRPSAAGWGIPVATDIALALGLLSLAGKHVPASARVFLCALAVADDLGAIIVIAVFYTSQIALIPLLCGLLLWLLLWTGNRLGIRHSGFYLLTGIVIWYCILLSGIHATIAGVLVALTIPAKTSAQSEAGITETIAVSPLQKIETALHPWVAFVIMPLFALANAGMRTGSDFFPSLLNPVSAGICLGLVAGKYLGISAVIRIMVRFKWAVLPAGASWRHMNGIALLAGVGFTMSLFITGLAFNQEQMIVQAKYGILTASVLSGILGIIMLGRKK